MVLVFKVKEKIEKLLNILQLLMEFHKKKGKITDSNNGLCFK